MNEPTSTDNYVQIGDKVINRTVDASVTTDDVQLSDRVFVFKKNDDGSIKTVVNTTIQYVVDAFGADAVATKNEVVTLKNDVITLKEQASTYASNASESADTATTKASEASESATKAKASEENASVSEANAKASETNAKTSETNASESETNAKTSETNAKTSEANAKTSEATASTKATEASDSATSASTYKTEAESARDLAKQYRDEAETLSQSLCYFRKQTYAVSASVGATSITIPSEAQYRSGADILFVHNKGVYLKEGTDYTKTDTGITLTNALEVATTIEIDILRAVSTDSQSYDLLKGDKGTSVTSVEQTTTSTEDAGTNIVTVTLSDNTSSEFSIKNGSKGSKGDKGDKGDKGATYTASELLDMIYPVGAIYTSLENVSPASTLGGTWTAITDTFLYAQGSKTAGATGGEESHKLVESEVPSHSHTRGSMNITGMLDAIMWDDGKNASLSGAFTRSAARDRSWSGTSGTASYKIYFNASNSGAWTGSTSSYGGNGAHNNMPPYLVVYMWRRTA